MNVGILGVGKLGLVYALSFERNGLNVFASSYKQEYVEALQRKDISEITEPGIAELLTNYKNITFTTDNHEVIQNADIIYVMVATPSYPDGSYDITAVHQIADDVLAHPGNIEGKILIVGSTVNPGDCAAIQEKLKSRGVHVVYTPTFAAQGTVLRDIENPISLLLGTENSEVAEKCKEIFFKIMPDTTPVHQVHSTSAEILKISLNCLSTMRINYFNMIGQVMIRSGLERDIAKIDHCLSLSDRKKGNLRFGFGYGGPCFPRDNKSFSYYMDRIGMKHHYAELNDTFNRDHVNFLTDYFIESNTDNKDFYFPYISYKPGVKIFEESHQLEVCRRLLSKGYTVFVEPTQFIDEQIKESLEKEFGNRIQFKSLTDLQQANHALYEIKL